jgi:hypothetical protein
MKIFNIHLAEDFNFIGSTLGITAVVVGFPFIASPPMPFEWTNHIHPL